MTYLDNFLDDYDNILLLASIILTLIIFALFIKCTIMYLSHVIHMCMYTVEYYTYGFIITCVFMTTIIFSIKVTFDIEYC